MVQEGSGQTVLSAFPRAQTRLAGGGGGSGRKILLFLFVLTNVRHPHICVFDHVSLGLTWVRTAFLN